MGSPQTDVAETEESSALQDDESAVKGEKVYVSEIKNIFVRSASINSNEGLKICVATDENRNNTVPIRNSVHRSYLKLHRSSSRYEENTVQAIKHKYESKSKEEIQEGASNSINSPEASLKLTAELDSKNQEVKDYFERASSNIERLQKQLAVKLPKEVVESIRKQTSPAANKRSATLPKKRVQFSSDVVFERPPIAARRSLSLSENPEYITEFEQSLVDEKEEIKVVTAKYLNFDLPESNKVSPTDDTQVDDSSPAIHEKAEFNEEVVPHDKSTFIVGKSVEFIKTEDTVAPIPARRAIPDKIHNNFVGEEIELVFDNIKFSEPESRHIIVKGSSSEDSLFEIQDTLSSFVMEKKPKEKKRSSSFRKIFTGGFFVKDKKKEKGDDKKNNKPEDKKVKKTENAVFSDNAQNESNFNRNVPYRHTIDTHSRNENERNSYQKHPSFSNEQSHLEADIEKQYVLKHKSQYNNIKGQFSSPNQHYPTEEYVCMDNGKSAANGTPANYLDVNKYIDTTSSSNTLDSENNSDNYDALLLQAELQRQQNCTSKNSTKNNSIKYSSPHEGARAMEDLKFEFHNKSGGNLKYTDTPPRAYDTYQNVQLIKPKAIIPINSERPLPNPYQNQGREIDTPKTLDRNLNVSDKKEYTTKSNPSSEDTVYGTVYDIKPVAAQIVISRAKTSEAHQNQISPQSTSNYDEVSSPNASPKSPSLERSKLRLPPNRETVELQPRIKSPIPQAKVSTDKIIATELLKTKAESKIDNKLHSPSHQRLEIEIDYPENQFNPQPQNMRVTSSPSHGHGSITRVRSPVCIDNNSPSPSYDSSTKLRVRSPASIGSNSLDSASQKSASNASISQLLEAGEWHKKQNELSKMPPITSTPPPQITTNATVHVDSQMTPQSTLNMRSRSTMHIHDTSPNSPTTSSMNRAKRASTPLSVLSSSASLQASPKKEEMRQHVEAYFWKELKKMKDKEDMDLYQIHMSRYGYAEDPTSMRRGRSSSPGSSRNSKRSLSLPREVRNERRRESSQEDRSLMYNQRAPAMREPLYGQTQHPNNFVRGSPQRRTLDSGGRDNYENYDVRPIFRRGSLTVNNYGLMQQQNKKVSFSSTQNPVNLQAWPTKNGYVQKPPQRILLPSQEIEDDVFLPITPNTPLGNAQIQNERRLQETEALYSSRPPVPPGHRPRNDPRASRQSIQSYNQAVAEHQRQLLNENKIHNDILVRSNQQRVLAQQESPYGTRASYQIQESPYGSRQDYRNANNTYENNGNAAYASRREVARMQPPYEPRENFGSRQHLMREPPYGTIPESHKPMEGGVYGARREPVYGNALMRQPSQEVIRNEPLYASRQSPYGTAKEAMETPYGSRQTIRESPYGSRQMLPNNQQQHMVDNSRNMMESPYGSRQSFVSNDPNFARRQVTVSNKVCDMYGKIHESASPNNQISQTGVLYGRLQQRNPRSPLMPHNSYTQLSNNFVRGSRLTASANDMYRRPPPDSHNRTQENVKQRMENVQDLQAPTRPLPPVPVESKTKFLLTRRASQRAYGDIDNGSEMSEVRMAQSQKSRAPYGK